MIAARLGGMLFSGRLVGIWDGRPAEGVYVVRQEP